MNSILILEFRSGIVIVRLDPAVSPLTYSRLVNSLKTNGRSNALKVGKIVIIPFDLGLVTEGRRTCLKSREVGYWVKKRSIVIALEDFDFGEQVNLLGQVVDGIDVLDKAGNGCTIKLSLKT